MILTPAAATVALTALAAKLAAGGTLSALELTSANAMIAEYGLTGFDVLLAAYDATTRAADIIKAKHEKKD